MLDPVKENQGIHSPDNACVDGTCEPKTLKQYNEVEFEGEHLCRIKTNCISVLQLLVAVWRCSNLDPLFAMHSPGLSKQRVHHATSFQLPPRNFQAWTDEHISRTNHSASVQKAPHLPQITPRPQDRRIHYLSIPTRLADPSMLSDDTRTLSRLLQCSCWTKRMVDDLHVTPLRPSLSRGSTLMPCTSAIIS
jgi:hypothetical protein